MPFSVAGAQLPLTAFFNTQSSQQPKRKAAEPRVATRRKDPADLQRDAGPSKKRKRQKENLAISSRKAVEQQDSAECTLKDASEGNLADVSVLQQDSPSEDRLSRRNKIIDLSHSPPSSSPLPPIHTDQPPVTPVAQIRPERPLAAACLPSPPLTAPTAKRARRSRRVSEEQEGARRPVAHADFPENLLGGPTAQVVGNKDAIVLRSPERGRGTLDMLPPPLPPTASSSSMPTRPPLRPPRSSSSDRWVPSSQSQELSIPAQSQKQPSVPHTPVEQMSQVVPSSQSHERELRISDVLPPMSDIYKTPVSPLKRCDSPVSPLVSDSEEDHLLAGDLVAEPSSPRFVQSSQSQTEHDLSLVWADLLGSRQASLPKEKQSATVDLPPSSPPRPVESQDYDAQDEYSQSQDMSSQPSTFASPDPRTSPLRTASQFADASNSSYSETPSQFREFVEMFDGRDEFGNELPAGTQGSSPSPAYKGRMQPADSGAGSSPPSHAYGSPRSGRDDDDLADVPGDAEDMAMEPSQSQSYAGDSDYGVASSSEGLPSQVNEFLDMFDDSQRSQMWSS